MTYGVNALPGSANVLTGAVSVVAGRVDGPIDAAVPRRGYETPRGGWDKFDIHHIKPKEVGGGNNFWNIAPVERQTHQSLFNSFWREFTEL